MNIIHEAIDYGIDIFDTCWEYHNGKSENRLARALAGRLDKVFFMTKVGADGHDKKVVMQQLEESLKRLRTSHLDLWQIHEVIYYDDPELHFAANGVVEALAEAKQQGRDRHAESGRQRQTHPAEGDHGPRRHDPTGVGDRQRYRLAKGTSPEPRNSPRLQADGAVGNARSLAALHQRGRRWALGNVQKHQEIRRRRGPDTARVSVAGRAADVRPISPAPVHDLADRGWGDRQNVFIRPLTRVIISQRRRWWSNY